MKIPWSKSWTAHSLECPQRFAIVLGLTLLSTSWKRPDDQLYDFVSSKRPDSRLISLVDPNVSVTSQGVPVELNVSLPWLVLSSRRSEEHISSRDQLVWLVDLATLGAATILPNQLFSGLHDPVTDHLNPPESRDAKKIWIGILANPPNCTFFNIDTLTKGAAR
jgi:hypothetical protein